MQDASLEVVVFNADIPTQRLQMGTAVDPQIYDLPNVVSRPGSRALLQESHRPAPLRRVQTGTEKQWCIRLEQPFEYLQGCRRIGPGFGMGYRYLTAVGITGFGACLILPVYNRHVISLLPQEPCACNTNNTCTQYQYMHPFSPVEQVQNAT